MRVILLALTAVVFSGVACKKSLPKQSAVKADLIEYGKERLIVVASAKPENLASPDDSSMKTAPKTLANQSIHLVKCGSTNHRIPEGVMKPSDCLKGEHQLLASQHAPAYFQMSAAAIGFKSGNALGILEGRSYPDLDAFDIEFKKSGSYPESAPQTYPEEVLKNMIESAKAKLDELNKLAAQPADELLPKGDQTVQIQRLSQKLSFLNRRLALAEQQRPLLEKLREVYQAVQVSSESKANVASELGCLLLYSFAKSPDQVSRLANYDQNCPKTRILGEAEEAEPAIKPHVADVEAIAPAAKFKTFRLSISLGDTIETTKARSVLIISEVLKNLDIRCVEEVPGILLCETYYEKINEASFYWLVVKKLIDRVSSATRDDECIDDLAKISWVNYGINPNQKYHYYCITVVSNGHSRGLILSKIVVQQKAQKLGIFCQDFPTDALLCRSIDDIPTPKIFGLNNKILSVSKQTD